MAVSSMDRLIAEAGVLAGGDHPCNVLGHKWEFTGGTNCCCEAVESGEEGGCSVPVHHCPACGDYDYGENDEAREIRAKCAAKSDLPEENNDE